MNFLFPLFLTAVAAYGAANDQTVVEVYLPSVSLKLVKPFMTAKRTVNEIYNEIGVKVIWRSASSQSAGCELESNRRKIIVAFVSKTPDGIRRDALAFANPYVSGRPCVTLLMGRLNEDVALNPSSAGVWLGHAIAHEFGHVLERSARHSETGLMKAHYSQRELMDMTKRRLHFADEDRALILLRIEPPPSIR